MLKRIVYSPILVESKPVVGLGSPEMRNSSWTLSPLRLLAALLIALAVASSGPVAGIAAAQSGTTPRGTTPKATTPKATTPKAAAPKATTPRGEDTPLNLDTGDDGGDNGGGPSGGSLVRTIIGLAIVIGVIYGVTWVLKQMRSSQEERATGAGLSSEATLPLGPGRSIHLVKAGDEYLLVGVSDDSVSLLRSYSAEEARSAGLLDELTGEVTQPARAKAERPSRVSGTGTSGGSVVDRLRDLTVRR